MVPKSNFWAGSEDWPIDQVCNTAEAQRLRDSHVFDRSAYAAATGLNETEDLESHFLLHSLALGLEPNFYFSSPWYSQQNPTASAWPHPIIHYLAVGEASGCPPSPWFDLAWYKSRSEPISGGTFLADFLARRIADQLSPIPEFDTGYYLSRYPDVAAAGIDPFEHYFCWGFREGRDPSPDFNTKFYIRRYLGGQLTENPLLHFRRARPFLCLITRPEDEIPGLYAQIHRSAKPGPDFEEFAPLPQSVRRRAEVLAFYLPQFHPIAENDAWWGTGFTEWTSIARGVPRFAGHYQPRIPRDLGHYTLTDTAVMRRQAALAKAGGVSGFVHYFYWFNGKRLLEGPTEAMLADPSVEMPFCLMWANENWTRRWDGSDKEILIAQDWRPEDEPDLIACLLRHMRDPRYIRLQGRPVLMVYRPAQIPNTKASVARWRTAFREAGEDPIFIMSQSFDAIDPRDFDFDAAVEFPPHKLVNAANQIGGALDWYDPTASTQVYDYAEIAAISRNEPDPPFPLIKTAVPSWDNEARRQGRGLVLHGATPSGYEAWLSDLVARAQNKPIFGTPIVCISAWNEWAEGAYLEPDVHFGAAFLNATGRAVAGLNRADAPGLLLVGHDAFHAGAQTLLLQIARRLRAAHGMRLEVLLLGDGALLSQYQSVAPTVVATDVASITKYAEALAARGFAAALVNSAASARAVPILTKAGLRSVLLIHELPKFLTANGLLDTLPAAIHAAIATIVPSPTARTTIAELTGAAPDQLMVAPQGCYRPAPPNAMAREAMRGALELGPATKLVLGAGRADLRKGFDLFLQAWRSARRRDRNVVFVWIGAMDEALAAWLDPEINAAVASGSFLLPGHQAAPENWYAAADVFALTSREDPFPSVVLEALSAGLPTVAFEDSGGIPDLLTAHAIGRVVPMGDAVAFATAALELARPDASRKARLAKIARRDFDFPAYTDRLQRLALPNVSRISVIVPSFNYAKYLPRRLASIFSQTHPVHEIILLDDASTDDSVEVAKAVAAEWNREIRIVANKRNSGSVFRQWRRGAQLAGGDFIWIAEADDEADPEFLATLVNRLAAAPDADMLACDSRAIDSTGQVMWPDHKAYYTESGAAALARDAVFPSRQFAQRYLADRNLLLNVSAVVWRTTALRRALVRCGAEAERLRVAGDWRIYLDLLAHSSGTLAWASTPLNAHRRHTASVTGSLSPEKHLAEIEQVQQVARATLDTDGTIQARQEAYLRRLARDLGVGPALLAAAD